MSTSHNRWRLISCYITLTIVLFACTDDGGTPTDTFDRKAMLTDVADKVILPAYGEFLQSVDALQQEVDEFTTTPSVNTLDRCRTVWKETARRWQHVITFDFGPAEGLYGNLSVNVGTFPATATKIETYITTGDTTQNNFDRDARGLYGAEYLLFDGPSEAIVAAFTGSQGAQRSAYLRSIIRKMYGEVSSVNAAWRSGYRDEFIARSGTDAGSGTSLLFNYMNISFELAKNYKLALPLGKRAGQAGSEPTKVEGFYSGISMVLMQEHYLSAMRLWHGRTLTNEKVLGFKDYLQAVIGGDRLVTDTEIQDQRVVSEFDALGTSIILSDVIISSPSTLDPLYTEMFKLTRFIKSEMSSLLGISITYSSGDGD